MMTRRVRGGKAYLASRELGISCGPILIVGGVEVGQRSFVSLADLSELLHMTPRGGKVDLSNLQGRPAE